MRRHGLIALALLTVLVASLGHPSAALHAQDGTGLSADEQAALDTIRAAFEPLINATTITQTIEQNGTQRLTVDFQGENITISQETSITGESVVERVPDADMPNQQVSLNETITQTLSGTDVDESVTVGPIMADVIAVDGRLFMRLALDDPDAAMQTVLPSGWQEITDGAEAFPGMNIYQVEQLMSMGQEFFDTGMTALWDEATAVTLPDASADDGSGEQIYTVAIDPPAVLEIMGSENMAGIFSGSDMPFDVERLFEVMFNDEDTRYSITVHLSGDGQLRELTTNISIDTAIAGDLITDPTLAGAEITLVQEVAQTSRIDDLNGPVSITVPAIDTLEATPESE